MPPLPAEYASRPATAADVPAIHALVQACERELYGHPESDPDAVAAQFARPGLDMATDTVVITGPAGGLAGWAWVNRRSEVDVHPDHRGRGLGAALLAWTVARAREHHAEGRAERLVQTVPDGDKAATELVRSQGFQPMVTSWLLGIDMATEPEPPEPPPGITVRTFRPGDEHPTHQLLEDAFDEWQERRRSYEEWSLLTVARETFAPELSPLAFDGDEMVGAVLSLDPPGSPEGYVERVAVRRDQRNKGIARLLLRHAFRSFYRQGKTTCTLWTHSNTGALSLYQRVGMDVRRSSTVYSKALTAA